MSKIMSSLAKIAGLGAIASVGSLAVAFNANAALLFSSTDSFTNQLTELNGGPTLTLTKYNLAPMFVLDKVVVTAMATLRSSGTVTNNSANTEDFELLAQVFKFDLTPAAGAPAGLTTLKPFPPASIIGDTNYSLASGASDVFGPFSTTGSTTKTFITGSQFLGVGTFSVNPFTKIGQTFIGGGGNQSASIATFADAKYTIEYYGHKVVKTPEPSALMGLGLIAGLGLVSLRKKNTSENA